MSAVFIDTHAHLCDEKFDEDRVEVIARAAEAGVAQIISMGDTMAASAQVVADAEQYPALYAAVGVHPESACVLSDAERAQLLAWANHPKVVAIGEIGLDYYWEKDPQVRAVQREMFVTQLDIARAAGLPVCIHDREAHGDTLAILRTEGQGVTGVLHCYSGSLEMARALWKMGYYIGIDGPLTFKNAAKLPDIGKRNEPAYVAFVAAKIAELREESVEEVAAYTTENARRLYPKLGAV